MTTKINTNQPKGERMINLRELYKQAGYEVGQKDYIDNLAIREMLKPVVQLLLAKREEAISKHDDNAAYYYQSIYLEIWRDAGLTFVDLNELSDRNNKSGEKQ